MGKWRSEEHITLKEGRALVLCLRRLVRSSRHRNKRHVVLVDNLGLALCISKGRAKDFKMLRVAQQVSALCFVGSLTLKLRWIPSEYNVSDGPSRGQIRPGSFQCSGEQQKQQSKELPCLEAVPEGEEQESQFGWDGGWERSEENQYSGEEEMPCGGDQEEASNEDENSDDAQEGGCRRSWAQSPAQQDDNLGAEINFIRSSPSIPNIPAEIREFLPGQRVEMAFGEKRGRHSCRLLGRHVPRQSFSSRRREAGCSRRVQQCEAEGNTAEIEASAARMAQRTTSSKPVATTSSGGGRHGYGVGKSGPENYGFESDVGSRHVPATWRKHRHQVQGRDSASLGRRETIPLVRDRGPGHRGSKAGQSRHLRQHHTLEQPRPRILGRIGVAAGEGSQRKKRVRVPVHGHRVSEEISSCGRSAPFEESASIPMPSRRSVRGPQQWRPGFSEGEDKRALAYRSKCQKVCQDRKDSEIDGPVVSVSFGVLSLVTEKHRESLERSTCSPRSLRGFGWQDILSDSEPPHEFGLEIFAGTARICSALAEAGLPCFPIDICLFPSHNVLDIHVEHHIVHLLLSGRVKMLWLGMPCTSFSRARKWNDDGPDPLRDYDNIYGFPWLNYRDSIKVQQGNNLLRFSLRLLELCEQLRIPYALENPYSSYAWHMPPLKKFIRRHIPYVETLDYCQYGEDWLKPTTIMGNFWNVPAISRRCTGTRSMCSTTCRPHVPLSGRAANGLFRTLLAQPYPWALAELVARTVSSAINK